MSTHFIFWRKTLNLSYFKDQTSKKKKKNKIYGSLRILLFLAIRWERDRTVLCLYMGKFFKTEILLLYLKAVQLLYFENLPCLISFTVLLRQFHQQQLYPSACSWHAYCTLFLVRNTTDAHVSWKKWRNCSL